MARIGRVSPLGRGIVAAISALLTIGPAMAATPALLPWPAHVELERGSFVVRDGTPLLVARGDWQALAAARYLADLVSRTRALDLPVRTGTTGPGIRIVTDRSVGGSEAYRLTVAGGGIRITASAPAGLLYGGVSLWELLTQDGASSGPAMVQGMRIEDRPRFAWRGLMLDSARHFQQPAFVERLLDWMALHKLNVLHWHLVDDQGWRLEIKRYPRLTSVGAWRVEAGAAAAQDINPGTGKPRVYGGYYSQADVRRIVAHAARLNITIVPEIEIPGHETAAIAAYPQFGSTDHPPTVPSSDWGIHPNLLNPNDATISFIENVLDEVMALFPSTYIHVGGDEAVKDQWQRSPAIQARMKTLRLPDEDALQSWYIRQIEAYLNRHGRRLIGWDEILKGGLAPNASVMSWHGVDGAIEAAKTGHDAVLTPSRPLYFNYRQGTSADEPPGRAPLNTLADVYAFDPAPAALSPEQRRHVLGVQANLWTEYVRTAPRIEHMLFPRLAALAEIAWSPESAHDLPDFERRLVPEMARYRSLGIDAATSAFAVRVAASPTGNGAAANVALRDQLGFGTIHYTLDGSAPTVAAPIYSAPLTLALPVTLRAAAFWNGAAIVPPIEQHIDAASLLTRQSAALDLCKEDGAIAMEDDWPVNGPRAVFLVHYLDRCWFYRQAPMNGIRAVDVQMGSIPFNLSVRSLAGLRISPDGKNWLEIHLDHCDGPLLAWLSLDTVARQNGLVSLRATVPEIQGEHDLCLLMRQTGPDPIWTLSKVALIPQETASPAR